MLKTGSRIEVSYDPYTSSWVFYFSASERILMLSNEFIQDFKGSMCDLVDWISKAEHLDPDESDCLYTILHQEQKKAFFSYAYGKPIKSYEIDLLPPLKPRPIRALYLVDLGEGMLVPKAFIQDFLAWEKENTGQDSWYPDAATYEAMIESICAPSMTQEEADKHLAKYLTDLVNKYADPTSPSPYPKTDI